jgi:multiple antibiotic resistance protein
MSLFSLAAIFFLIVDPIGCIPAITALIKDYDFAHQKRILFRETWISLAIALFFQYFGKLFLSLLGIADYALRISGGILLLIVAVEMLFSISKTIEPDEKVQSGAKKEPFIFPIATPLLSGPGLLAIIMLRSQEESAWKLTVALLIAWVGVTIVLAAAPYLHRLLKRAGLVALEQIMGMLLAMIAIEMILNGSSLFIQNLK